MRANKDYLIIKVSSEMNDLLPTNIVDKNGKKIELLLDTTYQPNKHRNICGEVVEVPSGLSTSKDMLAYEVYPGTPKPAVGRGHDRLMKNEEGLVASGIPMTAREVQGIRRLYRSNAYEPEIITYGHQKIEIRKGDKVYFHFHTLCNENYIGRDEDGLMLFKVRYDKVFCYVRGSRLECINGVVLVEPKFDEDVKDIDDGTGKKIKGKTKQVGDVELVTEVSEKPKYLRGIVRHIGKGIGPNKRELIITGEEVIFTKNSEFKNTIEGIEYYVMRQWDIVALVVYCISVIPVGDYVRIDPVDYQYKGLIIVPEHCKASMKKDLGEISLKGELCTDEVELGCRVIFNHLSSQTVWLEEFNCYLVREGDILCYTDTEDYKINRW